MIATRPGSVLSATATCLLFCLLCGCTTTRCPVAGDYSDLRHPGDTMEMFRDCLQRDCRKAAYLLLSERIRNEEVDYTRFSHYLNTDEGQRYREELDRAEYVAAVFTNAARTRARMTLQSGGQTVDVPMALEAGQWKVDGLPELGARP